jgi:hypothetical protein
MQPVSILRRFLSGHSLFGADRDHIHHKLLAMGLSHRQAVWILYACSATGAILSISLLHPERLKIPVLGIAAVILFFGLRKLNYREFAEFTRLWKRVRQQKQVFARNIAVRKTLAEIERTHHFNNLLKQLEHCLRPDFCAIEIDLAPELIEIDGQTNVPAHTRRVWSNGFRRQSVLKLELHTAVSGHLGFLALYGCADKSWLVDTDLLSGQLCHSVASAIENCFSTPKFVVLQVSNKPFPEQIYAESPIETTTNAAL